ncbi:MAG: type II secretion system F family protein [archaeon]
MIPQTKNDFLELKRSVAREKRILKELGMILRSLENSNEDEKRLLNHQVAALKKEFKKVDSEFRKKLGGISLTRPLEQRIPEIISSPSEAEVVPEKIEDKSIFSLEKRAMKRLEKKEEKKKKVKEEKPRAFVKVSNRLFFKFSDNLFKKYRFTGLSKNIVRANMKFVPASYISLIFFVLVVSFVAGSLLAVFLIIFDVSFLMPFISFTKNPINLQLAKFAWIALAVPICAGLFTYFYPSLERKSTESKINNELPFATIHMSAISESLVNPKGIFEILLTVEEYPALRREFTKLLNEVNIHGMNMVNALRSGAFNSPSDKLADLLNGLATTINTGGDMQQFFDKRSQALFFEYKIERQKSIKVAETFLDIYISIVIAAPMILMLLLMMMKMSGLGISLSTNAITLIMVLGVSGINAVFLTFLHLKQPSK